MELNQIKINPKLVSIFNKFLNQFTNPIGVIYGNPETGKTDTSLLIAEIGLSNGSLDYFASNINTYGKGERITNLEDLRYWLENQLGKKLFILDEAGNNLFSREALKRLNRELIKLAMITRKFQAHIIFVLQEIAHLDEFKDSELTGMIIKKKKIGKEFIALIKLKNFPYEIKVRNMPKTNIPYNTLDVSPFSLEKEIESNIELKGILNQVAYMYAKHGNMSLIAKELSKTYGKNYRQMQVKRLLQKYLRETLKIEIKRGRKKKTEIETKLETEKPIIEIT